MYAVTEKQLASAGVASGCCSCLNNKDADVSAV